MKCKRCSSWTFNTDTCVLCGQPLTYETYIPRKNFIPDDGERRSTRALPALRKERTLSAEAVELLAEINAFLAEHNMKPTRFGFNAVNNPNLVRNLSENSNPTFSTKQRVREYMAKFDG